MITQMDKIWKRILTGLSSYPLAWSVAILFCAYFNILDSYLIVFIMITWVIALYFGALSWLGLLIYLLWRKALNLKQGMLHLLIAIIGIAAAYYTVEYDIFNSGVKYID